MECPSYRINWSDKPSARFSIKFCIPVVTWSGGTTSIYTVIEDQLGYLADENGNIIILN